MKIDFYTKAVLTVIALCLGMLVMQGNAVVAHAQGKTDRGTEVTKVQIVSVDESPSLRWEALPVKIER